jgi:hypothetical protein
MNIFHFVVSSLSPQNIGFPPTNLHIIDIVGKVLVCRIVLSLRWDCRFFIRFLNHFLFYILVVEFCISSEYDFNQKREWHRRYSSSCWIAQTSGQRTRSLTTLLKIWRTSMTQTKNYHSILTLSKYRWRSSSPNLQFRFNIRPTKKTCDLQWKVKTHSILYLLDFHFYFYRPRTFVLFQINWFAFLKTFILFDLHFELKR